MAVTQADIDRLNAAIASDERQVTLNGQTVIYRSTSDLIKARDDLARQLAAQNGLRRRKQTRLVYAGRGFDR
jgi:hypothetical protein